MSSRHGRHGHSRGDESPRRKREDDRSERYTSRRERYRDRSSSPSPRHSDRHGRDYSRGRRNYSPGPAYSRSPKRRRISQSPPRRESRNDAPPEVGSIHLARIQTIKPFGVFVELDGFSRHALIYNTQVSEDLSLSREEDDADKVTALEYFCRPGSKVWVKVVEVTEGERGESKISCSMKAVDQETGKDLDPNNSLAHRSGPRGGSRRGPLSDQPPEMGSLHKARVVSIRPFGVFVQMEGYRSNGLVHVSQVSDHIETDREDSDEAKIGALSQVLAMDESVWVKVVEIKDAEPGSDRGPKIGCSIKLVSQRDGHDLDPHGLKFRPRQGDGGGGWGAKKPVGADAAEIQQGGNIDWGYLNADKVNLGPQDTGYDLVEELPQLDAREPNGNSALPPPPKKGLKTQQKLQNTGVKSVEEALAILEQHKKAKKEKKEKKGKKDKKKHKKEKKSKKRKREKASDSNTDSSG